MKIRSLAIGLLFTALLMPASAVADRGEGGHGKWKERFEAHRSIVEEFCAQNVEDKRCVEIKQHREEMRARFEACNQNPAAEGCERFAKRREKMQKKCAENPDRPFCKKLQAESASK